MRTREWCDSRTEFDRAPHLDERLVGLVILADGGRVVGRVVLLGELARLDLGVVSCRLDSKRAREMITREQQKSHKASRTGLPLTMQETCSASAGPPRSRDGGP